MKYKIRDKYAHLREFSLNLPGTFHGMGGTIRDYRNVIKIVDIGDEQLVVKNFRGMYFFNRLAYSLFRKSKAVRSYEYSERLNDHGIKTPAHVAWINCYSLGLLTESFFVSVYCPWPTLERCMEGFDAMNDRQVSILRHLATFTHRLHELGIFHFDFSVGNILVREADDSFDFALLDLNRIKFGTVKSGFRNFSTLNLPQEAMDILVRAYAAETGADPGAMVERFWRYKHRKAALRRWRKALRNRTLTPLEKFLKKK